MKNKLSCCLSTILICCLLTACLPGKKQEEKVISDASKATQAVQAEKLAADMGIAAQMLMLNHTGSSNNNNLQTVECGDGKVVAFVPTTSPLIRNNALPAAIGNRMFDQLTREFGNDAVKNKQTASQAACATLNVAMVALNSPVLVMDNKFAVQPTEEDKSNGVVAMKVDRCVDASGKEAAGVIITKTMKDGTTSTDSTKCGEAIEKKGDSPDVQLSEATMPNWKNQLTGVGSKTENFKCIVRDKNKNACVSVDAVTPDEVMICKDNGLKENYLINPVYQKGTGNFVQDPTKKDCGKGWVGELVARVTSTSCTITRDQKTTEPATVYEIAYVAAKCDKDDVMNVVTQCPAGDGSFYARYSKAQMLKPTALEPQPAVKGKPTPSLIAMPGYKPSDTALENIKRVTNAQDLYIPTVDLRTYSDENKFSSELVRDMGVDVGVKLQQLISCNVVGNQCATTSTDHLLMVVDRSVSMGSKDENDLLVASPDIVKTNSCKAGLKNIFKADLAQSSCNAAKAYQATNQYNLAEVKKMHVFDFIKTPWAGKYTPSVDKAVLYQQMQDSLIDRDKYTPYLQYALATGWDCGGRVQPDAGAVKESFPMDMFGYCDGSVGCTSCPGECSTVAHATLPPTQQIRRIDAANLTLEKLAKMELKPGTKVTTATFINDIPQVSTVTYCPPERRVNNVCDYQLERQVLLDAFTNRDSATASEKRYVKPVTQDVVIPTEKPTQKVSCEGESECTGPSVDNWENAVPGNNSNPQMNTSAYDYTSCIYMPPNCSTTPFSLGNGQLACMNETERQTALVPSNYNLSDLWQTTVPYAQAQEMGDDGKLFNPVDITNMPIWTWVGYATSGGDVTLYCSKRVPKGTASSCGPQTGPGKRKTVAEARADGTFQNSYLPTPAKGEYGYRYQDISNYEFTNCAQEQRCNGNCAAVYGDNWLTAIDTVNGYNGYTGDLTSFCKQRRAKDKRLDAAQCDQCDVSECANLGSTAPSTPSTPPTSSCDPISPPDYTSINAYGPPQTGPTNRFGFVLTSTKTYDVPVTFNFTAHYTTVSNSQGTYNGTIVLPANETTIDTGIVINDAGPGVGDGEVNTGGSYTSSPQQIADTSCVPSTSTTSESTIWQNWKDVVWTTDDQEKFDDFAEKAFYGPDWPNTPYNVKTDQVMVDPDHEYRSCKTIKANYNPAIEGGGCATYQQFMDSDFSANYNAAFGAPPVNIGRTNGGCDLSVVTPFTFVYQSIAGLPGNRAPWLKEVHMSPTKTATSDIYIKEYVVCNERSSKETTVVDSEALAACLDRCSSKVLAMESVETCHTATNLFSGVTTTGCSNVAMPSKLDYRPKVYSGGSVTKTITRYVPAKKGDPGAIEVSASEPAWGIDFGGNTPLYKTLDQVLSNPDVQTSINDKKRLSLIVVTDGVDTAGSPDGIKSLCGEKDSLMTKIGADGDIVKPFIISVNDKALSIVECNANSTKFNNSYNLLRQQSISDEVTLSKIRSALGGQPTSDRESAIKFCMNNYGSYYIDERVPSLSLTGNESSCRPFELQN